MAILYISTEFLGLNSSITNKDIALIFFCVKDIYLQFIFLNSKLFWPYSIIAIQRIRLYSAKMGPIMASQISTSTKMKKIFFYFFNRNSICDHFLVQYNLISFFITNLYRKKQTGKISTPSGSPCEIFEGAISPYKDIRLENYCFQAYMDPIWSLYKATSKKKKSDPLRGSSMVEDEISLLLFPEIETFTLFQYMNEHYFKTYICT